MKTFNKCLEPSDYGEGKMGLWTYAYDFSVESRMIPFMPNPHLHRRWEYGMAMEFLGQLGDPEKIKRILDVGGAGSLFAPIAMAYGYHVTVVDPDPCVFMLAGQARATGGGGGEAICADFMEWGVSKEDGKHGTEVFDAVVSLSTIEHIGDDVAFIKKLAAHAERGLFLTTDFSMDGGQYSTAHLRTYPPKTMKNKLLAALGQEWNLLGEIDWKHTGLWVDGYNFSSLGVAREKI